MSIFKCKMCGGNVIFDPGSTVGECDSCGSKQTLPKTEDDQITNLFNRANNLRLKCEFDKAEAIYEKIVEKDDSEAEAHWGIVLCKYGIEYVEDPKTGKRMPTCHRTLFDAVTADPDYQAAVDYAEVGSQSLYESEARAIDRIQKDILAIVKNEKPFDVFICYKETDENGKRTVDSTIANDIYYQLTQEGFKVFYAAITLEDKLGQEYEPYIFAALNSAKVMLVVGTKPEYFNAVWVKNEWSRYLRLMKTDRSKLLIPCYRDMDAYDLPEEFAHLQAQDMSKIGFINDVTRGIKKVLETNTPKAKTHEIKESVVSDNEAGINISPLLERAYMFLEDGNWDSANEYSEKILDQDPKNAQAYVVKLMAETQVNNLDELKNCSQNLSENSSFKKALRFADPELSSSLLAISDINAKKCETIRLNNVYTDAIVSMKKANSESDYRSCAAVFREAAGIENADECAIECSRRADYLHACTLGKEENIDSFKEAVRILKTLSGWESEKVNEKINLFEKKITYLTTYPEVQNKKSIESQLDKYYKSEANKIRITNHNNRVAGIIIVLTLALFFLFLAASSLSFNQSGALILLLISLPFIIILVILIKIDEKKYKYVSPEFSKLSKELDRINNFPTFEQWSGDEEETMTYEVHSGV